MSWVREAQFECLAGGGGGVARLPAHACSSAGVLRMSSAVPSKAHWFCLGFEGLGFAALGFGVEG